MSEMLTALVTLMVITILIWRQWGTDYFGGVVNWLVWLLPGVPLALLRDLPFLLVLGVATTHFLYSVSFPSIRPGLLQR